MNNSLQTTPKKYVYLAGPIAGCTAKEANDWREYVSKRLNHGIIGINPLRNQPLPDDTYDLETDPLWTTHNSIMAKNMYDTKQCNIVLAYMPLNMAKKRPSVGTIMEMAWTIMLQKPLIVVTDDPYIKSYPLLVNNCGWMLDSLDDAITVCNGMLTEYLY